MEKASDPDQRAYELHRAAIGLVTVYVTLFDGTASRAEAQVLLDAAAGGEFSVGELLCGVSAVAAGLAQMVAEAAGAGTTIADVLQHVGRRAASLGE
ncbi:MAG: hypothetical protein ACRDS1_07845 [Pseudonocardiaceae bacterium]